MIYSAPIGASADAPRRDVAGRTPNAGVDFECSRLAASAIAASASIVARSKAISRAWAWRFAELLCGDATSAECLSKLLVLLRTLLFLLSLLLRLLPELLEVERLGGLLAHLAFSLLVAGAVDRLLARSELSLLIGVAPKLGAARVNRC